MKTDARWEPMAWQVLAASIMAYAVGMLLFMHVSASVSRPLEVPSQVHAGAVEHGPAMHVSLSASRFTLGPGQSPPLVRPFSHWLVWSVVALLLISNLALLVGLGGAA